MLRHTPADRVFDLVDRIGVFRRGRIVADFATFPATVVGMAWLAPTWELDPNMKSVLVLIQTRFARSGEGWAKFANRSSQRFPPSSCPGIILRTEPLLTCWRVDPRYAIRLLTG